MPKCSQACTISTVQAQYFQLLTCSVNHISFVNFPNHDSVRVYFCQSTLSLSSNGMSSCMISAVQDGIFNFLAMLFHYFKGQSASLMKAWTAHGTESITNFRSSEVECFSV
ncbi:hypothetical protein Nepgr_014449 [Nepenthes gracilis]|uniref:Uncharacterized protein n=1 Tax=Nepenthes gracilis TaxID=150966 RepID=A0AAD3SK13_NEPGR|nr:hypothetical protein Nepgr_014449 [Nepenthes gracilis]